MAHSKSGCRSLGTLREGWAEVADCKWGLLGAGQGMLRGPGHCLGCCCCSFCSPSPAQTALLAAPTRAVEQHPHEG